MLLCDVSLKRIIVEGRKKETTKKEKKYNFSKFRKTIQKFFSSNVDDILENKKVMIEVEMYPFEWKLVKLMNGKTKALIVREKVD
jgi:hypothetical protein